MTDRLTDAALAELEDDVVMQHEVEPPRLRPIYRRLATGCAAIAVTAACALVAVVSFRLTTQLDESPPPVQASSTPSIEPSQWIALLWIALRAAPSDIVLISTGECPSYRLQFNGAHCSYTPWWVEIDALELHDCTRPCATDAPFEVVDKPIAGDR